MKKIIFFTAGLFIGFHSLCQTNGNEDPIHALIQKETDQIYDSLVKIRRDFHRYPELGGHEKRTSGKIESYLQKLGLTVKTNIGGYGVVGILEGNKDGKHIAWRADIDAFQSDVPDVVEFGSLNKGVRHICGHDIHTAIALGMANVLSKQKDKINGTIYFLFQPSEENLKGAKAMIDDGLFEIINPDEIYGLHMSPWPTGSISTKSEEIYAYIRRIRLTFEKDIPIDSVKQVIREVALDLLRVKPESRPWELQHAMHPEIGFANPNTIYQDYLIIHEEFYVSEQNDKALFEQNLYETNKANLENIIDKIRQHVLASRYRDKLISVEYVTEDPAVFNDKELTESAIETISGIYGKQVVIPNYGIVPFFSDDFARLQQRVPGTYFFLGGSNFEKGLIAMSHAPDFAADEESIKVGVKYFSSLIIERTKTE